MSADPTRIREPRKWQPKMGVTQAKLCDLVEQIVELRHGTLPPVAVVISAWDTVREELTPEEWLPWRLPLLAQWLNATDVRCEHKLFGISAQGGDLGDHVVRAQLAKASRIGRPGGVQRLMAPVQWLLDAQ